MHYIFHNTHTDKCASKESACAKSFGFGVNFAAGCVSHFVSLCQNLEELLPEIISVIRSTHVYHQLQILQLIQTWMSLEELVFVLRDLK